MDRRGELLGWEAIGRVDTGHGYCTGTLIARDIVLTAAHCLFNTRGQPISAQTVSFKAGYHHGQQIAHRQVIQWVAPEGFNSKPGAEIDAELIANDVALLKLDRAIVSAEADPFRVLQGAAAGAKVSVVSYGRGRDEVLSRQAKCSVKGRYRDGILGFDCDVTFGSSGAPVFIREDGRLRILSIISGGTAPGEAGSIAYGMTLPPVVDALMTRLRRDAALPKASAGAKRISVGGGNNTGAKFVRP
ncbi:trypsin-like serine peptidase [Thalassococcus lentus]|uniref:Serine protease n=1 Tax=Thalassococcus lentus TaxID=1210524 RepID=A0ABT4XMT6_9RHOB|nr:trypsin-like peptidase domain-containing protein [Thalassococcus lentus]MDA7423227.1 trypsin-like peptidase domain-containing protein [Thalassococcus lentus]